MLRESSIAPLSEQRWKQSLQQAARDVATKHKVYSTNMAEPPDVPLVDPRRSKAFVETWVTRRLQTHSFQDAPRSGRPRKANIPEDKLRALAVQVGKGLHSSKRQAVRKEAIIKVTAVKYNAAPKHVWTEMQRAGLLTYSTIEHKHGLSADHREARIKFCQELLRGNWEYKPPHTLPDVHNVFYMDQKVFYVQLHKQRHAWVCTLNEGGQHPASRQPIQQVSACIRHMAARMLCPHAHTLANHQHHVCPLVHANLSPHTPHTAPAHLESMQVARHTTMSPTETRASCHTLLRHLS